MTQLHTYVCLCVCVCIYICIYIYIHVYIRIWASLVAQKASACNLGDLGSIPGSGRSPGEMATLSSILVWRIPWTEEPGRPQSMGSQSWTQLSNFTSYKNVYIHSFKNTLPCFGLSFAWDIEYSSFCILSVDTTLTRVKSL